jgi:hypothetical protein
LSEIFVNNEENIKNKGNIENKFARIQNLVMLVVNKRQGTEELDARGA